MVVMKNDLILRLIIFTFGITFAISVILLTLVIPLIGQWNMPITGIACLIFGLIGSVGSIYNANEFTRRWGSK